MMYGDEYYAEASPGMGTDELSTRHLGELFVNAQRLTSFESASDSSSIHDPLSPGIPGLLSFRIDENRLIDINDVILRSPVITRNEVADVISFQFVSAVKRSEFLGKRKNVHNLGPALIVSVVPKKEVTYRVPKVHTQIRHVVVNTTLSNLLPRTNEAREAYPGWLLESIDGTHMKPRQRVFFLEDNHQDAIWSCFHLPVSGTLLSHWMCAKFDELLCIGLQILKNSCNRLGPDSANMSSPYGEKIRHAQAILGMEYANPPPMPKLARQLGISETRLKSRFKAINGTTVLQYCINKRIDAAKLLLKENRHSISEIAGIVGYEDHSSFSRAFRRHSGCSPREWRRGDCA